MKKLMIFFLVIFSSLAKAQSNFVLPSLAPMLDRVMPSIVNISVQGILDAEDIAQESPKHRRKRQPNSKKFDSMGSGVIFDGKHGYIVTNAHVVHKAQVITVTLNDGRRVPAKLIGADSDTDIAVLQIKAENLQTLSFGDSQKLRVGDFVVAIGNPFGLNSFGRNQSATFGIVSALKRNTLNIEGVENFIQTDAAINPGNSGGALVTTSGELVGINTAILAPFGGNIGIGFAIPANMVDTVVRQLIQYGSVNRGLMGVFVQHLTPELSTAFGLKEGTQGALITQVNEGSPAEQAGLKAGDVIQKINDTTITDSAQVKTTIGLLRVGSKVRMVLIRDKKLISLNAIVASAKQQEKKIQQASPFLYGVGLTDFSQQSPLHGFIEGVQVTGASEQSAAWVAGIRPGDVITSVNGHSIKNLAELDKVVKSAKKQLLVRILRGPGALYLIIK